ncbi:MAG: PPC domain-containing protein [Kofleriaceae bacterium]|nr:PPC domain-containing protein [Kofleriaceae bacterium]MBP6837962.1 PPC domain-containing protein [Kofleriaceae bacterium]MBP9207859.1 PPC domain-containing protein [Kofleriaceae bacterium]
MLALRTQTLLLVTGLASALAACGDDGGADSPDARTTGTPDGGGGGNPDANTTPTACTASSFECPDGLPVCDFMAEMCVAAVDACTGDDAAEPNDGPSQATVATGLTLTGSVCSQPSVEGDWFRVTLTAGSWRFNMTWTATADLDAYIYDMAGTLVARGISTEASEVFATSDALPAGDYYVEILQYDPMATAAATAYSMTIEEAQCAVSFDCASAAAPVCNVGLCEAGPAQCTGDDAGDTAGTDDGPAGARPYTAPVTAAICNTPGSEADWYSVTVTAGQGLIASAAFANGDIDVVVLDSTGQVMGQSFWRTPEVVTLTYLPAGTYYVVVTNFADPAVVAALPYTLTVTTTAAQTCTTSTQCAAVYSTQYYRGSCTAGVCQRLAPAAPLANGMPCDSGDDCTSGFCSYLSFEADAQDSVCSTECTSTAECAAVGAGLTCTTGFNTNFCLPACASNLECGVVSLGSDTLDPGQPWDYLTCTTPGAAGSCGPDPM